MESEKKIKAVKFKEPNAVIHVPGGEQIHQGNLTVSKYLRLIELAPAHESQFDVEYEDEPKKNKQPATV